MCGSTAARGSSTPSVTSGRGTARRWRRRWTAASRGSSGPRRPGLGETQPATSQTSAATSPAILPSTRETPTSRTAAPGLTMSAVMMPGTPAAATTMSALRTWAARSRVPVWHRVTVAFSERRVSSSPSGRPDGEAATDHDHLGAGDRHAVAAQQLEAARPGCRAAGRARRARACRGCRGAGRRRPCRGRRARAAGTRRGRSAAGR